MVSPQLLEFIDRCQVFAAEFDLGADPAWNDLESALRAVPSFACVAERIVAGDVLRRVRAHIKRRNAIRLPTSPLRSLASAALDARTTRQREIVRLAVSRIAAYYQNPHLSAARLAQDMRVSRWDLGRAFARVTGHGVRWHLSSERVARAEDLIRTTSMSLKEIGYAVGFCSAAEFSRHFRALRGVQPSLFRDRKALRRRTQLSN
jgi:transcriptional regulator GlxA family with amidase domain